MKVLHLPYGGQMTIMCQALRSIGVEATSCHLKQIRFRFKPDICLHLEKYKPTQSKKILRQFLDEAAQKYDVFHFHFGATFLPDRSDLAYLKNKGKKLIMQHRGSDVRQLSIARNFNNPYVTVKSQWKNEEKIRASLKQMSKYIDHALVADHELLPYIKDYYKHVHLIRQMIDLSQFTPAYPSIHNQKPLIVHCPTHQDLKGTKYVLEAINKLRNELKGKQEFEFLILENRPHHEVLKAYSQADIIIDQLRIGAFGITSLEAMASGKPVICYIREDLLKTYPQKLPILNANPETIDHTLKTLIQHPFKRKILGIKGRKYIEKHYDSIKVAKELANLYKSL